MMENWQEIKHRIDVEIGKIWLEESPEIERLRNGIISTRAGSYGQYFSTLVFALIYTLTLGEHILYGLIEACDDEKIGLDSIKRMTSLQFARGFQSTEFLAYLGFEKTHEFLKSILSVMDALQNKTEYRELMGSFFTYMNILHWWVHLIFPWYLGPLFPQRSEKEIRRLLSLLDKRVPPDEKGGGPHEVKKTAGFSAKKK